MCRAYPPGPRGKKAGGVSWFNIFEGRVSFDLGGFGVILLREGSFFLSLVGIVSHFAEGEGFLWSTGVGWGGVVLSLVT